jgi:hypothetical protein
MIDGFLADPAAARDLLASRLHEAWVELVAPFWVRIRTLLDRDIEQRPARSRGTASAASSTSCTRGFAGRSAASGAPTAQGAPSRSTSAGSC